MSLAYEYGRMPFGRGDSSHGEQLLAEAVLLAETVGMPTLLRKTACANRTEVTAYVYRRTLAQS